MTDEKPVHNPKGAGRKKGAMPRNEKGQALTKSGHVAKIWQAGNSGNPDGSQAPVLKLRDAARMHGPRAIEVLVEIMEGQPFKIPAGKKDAGQVVYRSKDADRITAAKELLDRGYGKAPAKIDINDERSPVKDQTRDELTRAVTGSLEAIARLFIAGNRPRDVVEGTCEKLPDTVHPIQKT